MGYQTPVGGMSFAVDGTPRVQPIPMENYMQSKAGECWLAAEFAESIGDKKILSVVSRAGHWAMTRKVLITSECASWIYKNRAPKAYVFSFPIHDGML
jgi:hypothetical protein